MTVETSAIRAKLERVLDEIARAAHQNGREPSEIQLVVVTKTQPVETVQAAIEAGAGILGENYPEEAVEKMQTMPVTGRVEWHMIGHLQSRKAKLVARHFDCMHSLDSLSLAERLNRLLENEGRILPVLMEFNVGGEESKYGWQAVDESRWSEFLPIVQRVSELPNLNLQGLMTMPPLFDQPDAVRPMFARLRRLRKYLEDQLPDLHLPHLSMGTSGDFTAAIAEGSTFVRVGTAILGPRHYAR